MGDVLEYDFSNSSKSKVPPSLAARLSGNRRSSGLDARPSQLNAKPPSGRPAPIR
jgi:hypothetical protein